MERITVELMYWGVGQFLLIVNFLKLCENVNVIS